MAYVSETTRAKIKSAVKAATPKGWSVSVSFPDKVQAVATVRQISASSKNDAVTYPANNFRGEMSPFEHSFSFRDHLEVSEYRSDTGGFNGETLKVLQRIFEALCIDNYDNSDSQRDHFDVGHYVSLRFSENLKFA